MLQELQLTDYQAHKETLLSFDRGVNVIIGTSDSGKSSLIRSLCTVIENEPSGVGIARKKGKGKYTVSIVKDDLTVTRERSKSLNQYSIDGEMYTGFGTKPPQEVDNVLGFKPINIQRQMDSPFLLAESPGEVSRYLNKVADLSSIDRTLKNLSSMKKKTDNDITYLKQDLVLLEDRLSNLPDYSEIEKLISEGEEIEKEINYWNTEIYYLTEAVESIKKEQLTIDNLQNSRCDTVKVDELLQIGDSIYGEKTKLDFLQYLLFEVKNIENNIKEEEEKLNNLKKEYKLLTPEQCPLCGK